MSKAVTLLSFLAIVSVVCYEVSGLTAATDESVVGRGNREQLPYRTMSREEIEEIGGPEKDKLPYDAKAVEAGLNKLHSDGWELVAVEGGRTFTTLGRGQALIKQPSIYIFRRVKTDARQ